jgi:hypothetical protein
MDIRRFAEKHGLRVKRDDCGEFFTPCKRGMIYEHGSGWFGAMVIGRSARARAWTSVRRRLLAAGFTLHQDGDSEGSLLFNVGNEAQCREAIRVMGARRRRRYAPDVLQRMRDRAMGLGNSETDPPIKKGVSATRIDDGHLGGTQARG